MASLGFVFDEAVSSSPRLGVEDPEAEDLLLGPSKVAESCSFAREEGGATTFADSSSDCGLVFTIGRAKFLAKEAMDAKGVGDVIAVAEGPGEAM